LYLDVPGPHGTDSGPRAHLGRGNEPAAGANYSAPARLSTLCLAVEAISFIFTSLVVQGPEKTFTKNHAAHSDPCEVPKLEIHERPASTLRNVDDGPLGGADRDPGAPTIIVTNIDGGPLGGTGAGDPEAPTINAKKHQWCAPWSVLTEIWELPSTTPPLGGARAGDPTTPTINVTNVDGRPPGRCQSYRSGSAHNQC
jgi:hypothetical protein